MNTKINMKQCEETFFQWVTRNPKAGGFNEQIAEGLDEFPGVNSLDKLFSLMIKDEYFNDRHYGQVISAGDHYGNHVAK